MTTHTYIIEWYKSTRYTTRADVYDSKTIRINKIQIHFTLIFLPRYQNRKSPLIQFVYYYE